MACKKKTAKGGGKPPQVIPFPTAYQPKRSGIEDETYKHIMDLIGVLYGAVSRIQYHIERAK